MYSLDLVEYAAEKGERLTSTVIGVPDRQVTFFRQGDMDAWVLLGVAFVVLLFIDLVVLRKFFPKDLTMRQAVVFTLMWVGCAGVFNCYILLRFGEAAMYQWMSAYVLEWLLSFDNLFVFHTIFETYHTPGYLRHKPLFVGILGAVFFRLAFLFIGEYLLHVLYLAHVIFGAILIWTGIKCAWDDEDEDPADNWFVMWIQKTFPFVHMYDPRGNFFVKVEVDEKGRAVLPSTAVVTPVPGSQMPLDPELAPEKNYGATATGSPPTNGRTTQWRATTLVLVVICLEVSDIIFAVDSVSAVVAQVSDLYLAYSAVIFAMLGLRAAFFVIDVLAQTFSMFKYGIAAILVFIGLKLIFSKVVHIPAVVVCIILFSFLTLSVVASVIMDKVVEAREAAGAAESKQKV